MAYPLLARIRLAFVCFVLILALIAGLFVSHHLSATGFLVSVAVVIALSAVIEARFLLRMRNMAIPDPFEALGHDVIRRRLIVNAFGLAFIVFCLSLALWQTRNRPASSHAAILVIAAFAVITSVRSMRRDYARLKESQHSKTP